MKKTPTPAVCASLAAGYQEVILNSIADGVFTVDNNWTVTSFNKAAQKITGVAVGDAIGRKCWEVFHADVCECDCLLKKTLRTNRQCINKAVHIVNKNGKKILISVSTAILKSSSGEVLGGVETFRDLSEVEELRKEIEGRHVFGDIITRDHRLHTLFDTLPSIARSDAPVLILGESGTGKELLAKVVHQLSGREKAPFVAVNCSALPENLIESELFGYKKGAFTDAKHDKPGRFDRAKGGTLFLDEIGDLPKPVQAKLLRVLQEKIYEPLGGTQTVKSDVRIIAATNRDIAAMVKSGEFRQDLYYRINVMPLTLPPLRDRTGDVPLLVEHFIGHYNTIYRKNISQVSAEVMALLMAYRYPGNIRELENILQHSFVLCAGSVIEKKHLPESLFRQHTMTVVAVAEDTLKDHEKRLIENALQSNQFNRQQTAKALHMHTATLWRKMKKYKIHG